MSRVQVITFQGVSYRRYPDSAHRPTRTYFRAATSRGGAYLHRVKYETYNGPIPPGHRVVHRDGNPDNNTPVNLVALPHEPPPPRRTRAQMLAAAQSNLLDPDGRPCTCENCSTTFTTYRKLPTRFCSTACRSAHWRAHRT